MQSQTHSVVQKFQLKYLLSEEIDKAKQQLQACQQCNFTLLNEICYACNKKQVNNLQVEVKNQRYVKKIEKKDQKSLYIFCLDNSGSVQVDYNIEDGGEDMSNYDISDLEKFVNDQGGNFAKLKALGVRVLFENKTNIKDFIGMGASVEDVVISLQSQKNKPAKKVETRKSRKLIMKQIMVSILSELKTRDNCDYIITQGIEKVQLNFQEGQQKQAYSIGKSNAKIIRKYCSKQFNQCQQLFKNQKYSPNGGTALGPALVFCCGLTSQLKYKHNQIILITDGASNTGFGDLQSVKNLQNNPHASKVSQEYANIGKKYFIPNNISMNLLAFQDSQIKYYILDKFFTITGSQPILLNVIEKKINGVNDKYILSKQYKKTKDTFKFQVIDLPIQCSEHLKIAFICSNKKIKLQNKQHSKKGYGSIYFQCGKLNISKQNMSLILSTSQQISSLPSFTLTVIVQCQFKDNQTRVVYTKTYNTPTKKTNNQEYKKPVPVPIHKQEEHLSYKSDHNSVNQKRYAYYDDDDGDY